MASATDGHVCRVLIVDDDAGVRRALARMLELLDLEPTSAPDGGEALRQLAAGPLPCAILLDLRMPVLDGAGFLAVRAANPRLAAVPVLVIGSGAADLRLDAPVLPKPFGAEALRVALGGLLHRGR